MSVEVNLPHDTYHALWDLLNRTAPATKFVRVERGALADLLRDHAAMYSKINPERDYEVKR